VTESQQPPLIPSLPSAPKSAPLRPVLFIAVVFLIVMGVTFSRQYWTPEEKVKWRSDLPNALVEARDVKKPVLLYFTASWCGPCQWMKRNVFTEQSVAVAMDAYVPVRIDGDQHAQLAISYGVEAYPWFAVLDHEGRVVRMIDRGMEAQELIGWLRAGEGQ
jgi:thiol:disulfide interchange protein